MIPFAHVDYLLDKLNSPTWQSCLLAGIGLLLLMFRRYRTGCTLILFASGWIYLCATPAFVDWMRQGLESRYLFAPASSYPACSAIVVFGGDGMPNPKIDWQAEPDKISRNRLGFAYQLYRAGRAPVMVLSANKGGAVKMAQILETRGISSASLRVESRADNTYENALYSSRILKREKPDCVLLVTSPYHMPRAISALRRQGIDAIPAPTMPRPEKAGLGSVSWLPSHVALLLSRTYVHEYLGLWAYSLRGWT